jgi:hypothetical protein
LKRAACFTKKKQNSLYLFLNFLKDSSIEKNPKEEFADLTVLRALISVTPIIPETKKLKFLSHNNPN